MQDFNFEDFIILKFSSSDSWRFLWWIVLCVSSNRKWWLNIDEYWICFKIWDVNNCGTHFKQSYLLRAEINRLNIPDNKSLLCPYLRVTLLIEGTVYWTYIQFRVALDLLLLQLSFKRVRALLLLTVWGHWFLILLPSLKPKAVFFFLQSLTLVGDVQARCLCFSCLT